jgi:hypothetical protein
MCAIGVVERRGEMCAIGVPERRGAYRAFV